MQLLSKFRQAADGKDIDYFDRVSPKNPYSPVLNRVCTNRIKAALETMKNS
jgi:hypothetical protein